MIKGTLFQSLYDNKTNKCFEVPDFEAFEAVLYRLSAKPRKDKKDAEAFAERRGFKLYDEESLNTRLIDNKDTTNGK